MANGEKLKKHRNTVHNPRGDVFPTYLPRNKPDQLARCAWPCNATPICEGYRIIRPIFCSQLRSEIHLALPGQEPQHIAEATLSSDTNVTVQTYDTPPHTNCFLLPRFSIPPTAQHIISLQRELEP